MRNSRDAQSAVRSADGPSTSSSAEFGKPIKGPSKSVSSLAALARRTAQAQEAPRGRPTQGHLCDLDHLEATIALFDESQAPAAVQRYVTKHRAKKGHLRRFVLAFLRDASEPVTSRQITEAWITARSLNADEPTYVIMRKRIGACLIAQDRRDGGTGGNDRRAQGMVHKDIRMSLWGSTSCVCALYVRHFTQHLVVNLALPLTPPRSAP